MQEKKVLAKSLDKRNWFNIKLRVSVLVLKKFLTVFAFYVIAKNLVIKLFLCTDLTFLYECIHYRLLEYCIINLSTRNTDFKFKNIQIQKKMV